MPLGISKTTKAYLVARKYTFTYSFLVLKWPLPLHVKGKEVSWFQHLFKITYNITYNIPNIGKKALRQGSCQFLLCRNRHLQFPVHSWASLGQLWLGRGSE